MPAITVFSSSNGINVKTDPVRISSDLNSGVTDLAFAVNIDHDQTGRISRRKGFSATSITAPCYSLWGDGDIALYGSTGFLWVIDESMVPKKVATLKHGGPISYVKAFSKIFWVNGIDKGYVSDRAGSPWEATEYVGVETRKKFIGPPSGRLVGYHNGRIYICDNNALWFSEPFNPFLFDSVRGFVLFEENIVAVGSLEKGLVVSDTTGTFFVGATDLGAIEVVTKISSGVIIPGTICSIDGSNLGDGSFTGMGLLFVSQDGVCVVDGTGNLANLTRKKIPRQPGWVRGAAVVTENNYLALLSK